MFLCIACASPAGPIEGDRTKLLLLRSRASAAGTTGYFMGCIARAGFLLQENEEWLPPTLQGWAGAMGNEGWRNPGLGKPPAHPPSRG